MYGSIGKLGILKIHAATNQACCACIVSDHVFNKYLFYFLMFNKQYFIIKSFGGVQANISKEKIEATLMPLTNFEEQKLIVEKIESEFQKIDNTLNKLNIIKEQIKQYKQSVLKYAFDENNSFAKGSNYEPYEWENKKLEDISYKITDGSHAPPKKQENGIPMLSCQNIKNGKILFNNFRFISEDDYQKECKRINISTNDVLLTIVGSIGESAVVPDGIERFCLQRSVAIIKHNINSLYLKYFFNSIYSINYFKVHVRGTAQKGIYLNSLKNMDIKVPDIELQKTIADNIQNIFDKVDNIENNINENIDKLNVLKQAVLKKAFEGKLI